MLKRVNNGPDDDPEEYWFECDDCEGTGKVNSPCWENGREGISALGTCPGCNGLGFIEGDADDIDT